MKKLKSEKYLEFKTNMDKLVEEYNDELAEKAAEILSEISDTKYDKGFIKYYTNHWEDTKRVVEIAAEVVGRTVKLPLEDIECKNAVGQIDIHRIIYLNALHERQKENE